MLYMYWEYRRSYMRRKNTYILFEAQTEQKKLLQFDVVADIYMTKKIKKADGEMNYLNMNG